MARAAKSGAAAQSREALQQRVGVSLGERKFRDCIAPLCRLLLGLPPRDPERAVLWACLAVSYAETGRVADAQRALGQARAFATTPRGAEAVRTACKRLGA